MHDRPDHPDADQGPAVTEADRLVGRLIDGEATAGDRARFEALAAERPELRRALDETRADMDRLRAAFDRVVDPAVAIAPPPHRAGGGRIALGWIAAAVGWAAVAALALWPLAFPADSGPDGPGGRLAEGIGPAGEVPDLSAFPVDELLRAYLEAPHVRNELDPLAVEIVELDDGRLSVRYLRRIEEHRIVESEAELAEALQPIRR